MLCRCLTHKCVFFACATWFVAKLWFLVVVADKFQRVEDQAKLVFRRQCRWQECYIINQNNGPAWSPAFSCPHPVVATTKCVTVIRQWTTNCAAPVQVDVLVRSLYQARTVGDLSMSQAR